MIDASWLRGVSGLLVLCLSCAAFACGSEGTGPRRDDRVTAPTPITAATVPGGDAGSAATDAGPGVAPPTELPISTGTPTPGPTVNLAVNDAFFQSRLVAAGAPGAAMAIVKDARLVWSRGYGYADLGAGRPATPDTLFMLASVSKPVAATALLQLLEKSPAGLAALGSDVHAAGLPFPVRNPFYPNVPITFRMLLTHSSSLVDGPFFNDFRFVQGDSQVPLGSFLAQYVQDPQNWSEAPPGAEYSYSNSGASLVGYIVERLTGQNLQQACHARVFAPLGMNESSWFLAGLDPLHIAMPYELEGGYLYPQGHYGFPDYPDGQLRSSAHELSRFLMMIMGDGSLGGARILSATTVTAMKSSQLAPPNEWQGLVLYSTDRAGVAVVGHNGAYYGVSTDMWFDPSTRSGYVLLTNGGAYMTDDVARNAAMDDINVELLRLARSVP